MIILTDKQKAVINKLNDLRFTVSYIERYINDDTCPVEQTWCLVFVVAVNDMIILEEGGALDD